MNQDTTPTNRTRENSVESKSGKKSFSNMKNQSQINIGHAQHVEKSPLAQQETFGAALAIEKRRKVPQSTAQSDFGHNLLFTHA